MKAVTQKSKPLLTAIMVLAGAATVCVGAMVSPAVVCAAETVSFSEDVMPIFRGRCVSCHAPGGEGVEKSGLDLSTYEGVMKGTKVGPMVIPKDPDSSNLVWLLDWRGAPQTRMPHSKKKLSTCDRSAIRTWIREGAKNN